MHYSPFLCLLLFPKGRIIFFSEMPRYWDVIVTIVIEQQVHHL